MDRGEFIVTYTGISFYINDPHCDEIDGRDIAHALSLLCRGNGHLIHFYSVAQHCLNCMYEAKKRGLSRRLQLALLLHDGSEAYISDITRPVKRYVLDYAPIEKKIQDCVYRRFGIENLSDEENAVIKEIDDNMLCLEFRDNHVYKDKFMLSSEMTADFVFGYTDMTEIERQYFDALNDLKG